MARLKAFAGITVKLRTGLSGTRVAVLGLLLLVAIAFDPGPFASETGAMEAGAASCHTSSDWRCEPQSPAGLAAPTPAELELAQKHAPVVYMKQQSSPCADDGEAYYPIAVDVVLANESVSLYDGGGLVKAAPEAVDLAGKASDFYLDFPGEPKRPKCDYEQYFRGLSPRPEATVYVHLSREEGYSELALQYWFYFYFNDFNNKHEGDWEFIQLVFRESTADAALVSSPVKVIYSQHEGGERSDWSSEKLQKEGDRPAVYIAQGSHANQFQAANHLGKGEHGSGFGCDDSTGPSYRVDPRVIVLPHAVISSDAQFGWLSFEGGWGQRAGGIFNGPTGPATKPSWSHPLSWMAEQRDGSVTVPEKTIGPSAADTFCNVVAWGSRLLFEMGPAALLLFLLGFVTTVGVTSKRTRFSPVVSTPLRQQRQFGQILRSSLRIERENWRLFLGIGAIFLPLGVLTSGLQQLVISNPPVEPLLEVLDTSATDAAVVLGLGLVQFGLAYWLVVNATCAAVDAMSVGRPVGIAGAYRAVTLHLKDLFLARIGKLFVVLVLCLTVVGIPVAVFFGVRWLFVEQAILIEGKTNRESAGASREIVEVDSLRALGAAVAIVLAGIFTGPVIGGFLVLLTPWSLSLLNLISSTLYMALVPFVGIGLTLLYYDLKLKQAGRASDR